MTYKNKLAQIKRHAKRKGNVPEYFIVSYSVFILILFIIKTLR